MLLGYGSDTESDSDMFETKAETLPGCNMIQREMIKAVRGKDFFINVGSGKVKKPFYIDGISDEDFFYYYNLWEDFHILKILPEGRGTSHERRWYLNFLILFEKTYEEVVNFREMQAIKNSNR